MKSPQKSRRHILMDLENSDRPVVPMGPGTFLLLFLFTGSLTAIFVTAYSGIGFGLEVLEQFYAYRDEATTLLICLGGFLLFLWLFDAHRWPLLLQEFLYFIAFLALCAALLLLVVEVPYGPLCVYSVLMPILLVLMKFTAYKHVRGSTYTTWIYRVLVTQGVVLLIVFFYWTSQDGNMWDAQTRAYYSDRVGCSIDYDGLDECIDENTADDVPCFWQSENKEKVQFSDMCTVHCLDVYQKCQEAFITWAFPFLAAMGLLVTGFIAKYLKPNDPHSVEGVSMVARAVAIILFLLWIFASMAGAGEGVSNSLIAFAISLVIGSSIVLVALFWQRVEDEATKDLEAIERRTEGYMNVLKGLLILAALPLVFAVLLLSILNQRIRRFLMSCCSCVRYTDEEKEHTGAFTKAVDDHIEDYKTWEHAKVFTYAVYWGFGYIGFSVLASKFTTLFLSWLIEATSSMNVISVTGIVTAVGMFLFLLPPIPGIPIYLTSGIVLVSVGKDSMGLWGSVVYASGISLAIKLLACVMQQKMIGELFGKSVSVRQMVGINSAGIRAMRVILSDPKFTLNKVYVLVGGPDWPVSVLCGILGLDTLPILIGTIPVLVLIFPTTFCGSFAYMGSMEDENGLDAYPWADTMGAVASAMVAGTMICFNIAAAGAVSETLQDRKEEIDAIPVDEEVETADEVVKTEAMAYSKAVVWSNVPFYAKASLILAVACMIGGCAMLVLFNDDCFTEYDLMYTISEHLGGKWYKLVKPLGQIALLLVAIAYILLSIFKSWAAAKTKQILESGFLAFSLREINGDMI